MTSREDVIAALWRDVIRPHGDIDAVRRNPAAGVLLDAGCSEEALVELLLTVSYDAVFGCLYEVTGEPNDSLDQLHEDLLSGDPTGLEGADFLRR